MAQRDEVEEFLRRAAARRAAAAQGPGAFQPRPAAPPQPPPQHFQPPPRPATLAEVVMLQPVPPRPALVPQPSGWHSPVEAELIEPELVEIPDPVSRSVLEHMRGTQEIADRVRQLGAEVDQADDKLEARLHQLFDHSVGQLKVRQPDAPAKSAPVPSTAAFTPGDIAQMLLSPASIRSAIILGEVLRRPEDRW